jgi:hypothetical protein
MRTGESMKPLSHIKKNILFYGVYGFLLGSIFPVIGILYELIRSGNKISLSGLKTIHLQEPLLLIINLAPLVIATFAALVGLQSARLQKTSAQLDKRVRNQATQIQNEHYLLEALITNSVNHRFD